MNLTDLRIGNYVMINPQRVRSDTSIVEVSNIDCGGINRDESPYFDYGVHDILPIPITVEWLLKFGFKTNGEAVYLFCEFKDGIYPNRDYSFNLNKCKVELWVSNGEYLIAECEYMHQLQNLYFTLTGTDLTTAPSNNKL